jgi:nitrogen fixation NifU-like protein
MTDISEELYQEAILARAKRASGAGRLDAPDASVTVNNPVCGDRIVLDIRMDGDRVGEVGHDVRGCLLCEAAASIIGAQAPGADRAEIDRICDVVTAMMAEGADAPDGHWAELAIFAPVAAHKSRHHCVLLPFEALRRTLGEAGLTA